MNNDYTTSAFKELLKRLQEESWQLELIISGFAIYGLFSSLEPISNQINSSQNEQHIFAFVFYGVLMVSCGILLFNLLLHVLLRGLWIGALGLRYVSGDIDYETLNYSEKFTKYLKKKVGSFDKYIGTLENYCSIIFAVSFLLIFYVLAFTFTIITITIIANYVIDNDDLPTWISKGLGISLIVFIVFGMFFTFIDFITQGWLKKKKWISKIYFPIYWVFSFITLSFLYRPLVYNFLDNKFGKRLSFLLIPIYFSILLLTSFSYTNSNYFSKADNSSSFYANPRNYENELDTEKGFIHNVAIQSKVIEDNFIKVFIVYSENIEDRVFKLNPSLEPKEDTRGFGTNIVITGDWGNDIVNDSTKVAYLKAFNTIYSVKIDSLNYDTDFVVGKSATDELGFETYISTKELPEGKHLMKVKRMYIKDKDTTYWRVAHIPFWYFKD